MSKARFRMFVLMLPVFAAASGQQSLFDLKGQLDSYASLNFENPFQMQSGGRFIPSLSMGRTWKSNLKIDSEISFNTFAYLHFSDWKQDNSQAQLKPYRIWLRLSSERFELRAGLQKINFGSATMLRPLMWFDRMDPRDPLQLTDGVYAFLGRYYFQNNANAWFWVLWGNDKTKGWELVPSAQKKPEYGGRLQIPVPKGETGISFHHRTGDLSGIPGIMIRPGIRYYPEDRIGLDGKWDLGVGIWSEYVIKHSLPDTAVFLPWEKYFNAGMDYTFSLGNGLNVMTEYFRYSNTEKAFNRGTAKNFSVFSANYPFGMIYRISGILFYEWDDKSWYRFINIQRQTDNWILYLFVFWNPAKFEIYNSGGENNLFAGKGIQFMIVYNF